MERLSRQFLLPLELIDLVSNVFHHFWKNDGDTSDVDDVKHLSERNDRQQEAFILLQTLEEGGLGFGGYICHDFVLFFVESCAVVRD